MKKFLFLLIIAAAVTSLAGAGLEKKDTSKYGFSISIPSDWKGSNFEADKFQYSGGSATMYYSNYPFDSAGGTYSDYSVFTDEYRKSILDETQTYYSDYYFDMDYDVQFSKAEYRTINGKMFICLVYDGVYWDYEYEDYDYSDCFEIVEYIVLKDGQLHNFSFDSGYDYFTDSEKAEFEEIVKSIDF